MPTDKRTERAARHAALGDRASMAFLGTFVAAGQGADVAVGTDTELGRISKMLHGSEHNLIAGAPTGFTNDRDSGKH